MAVKAGYSCKFLVTKIIIHSNDIYNFAKKKLVYYENVKIQTAQLCGQWSLS